LKNSYKNAIMAIKYNENENMVEDPEWWPEVVRSYEKANASQGDKKLWNYFLDLTRREDFLSDVKNIRHEFGIPINGCTPDEMSSITKRWRENNSKKEMELIERTEQLSEKYGFHPVGWGGSMGLFVDHGIIERGDMFRWQGLCVLQDIIEDKADPYSEMIQRWDNISYPLAIKVSPYASERDIIDYIKRVYKTWIKPIQKHYQNPNYKIGRSRTKQGKLRERNDFIYENRNKPHREIMKEVNTKFKSLIVDYAQVGAIIREEKKRRIS